MEIIQRYQAKCTVPLCAGHQMIEIVTEIAGSGKPGEATLRTGGMQFGRPTSSALSRQNQPPAGPGTSRATRAPIAEAYAARRSFGFDSAICTAKVELNAN